MGAVWNDDNLRCKWLFSTQPEPSKGGVHKCFKLVYLARGLEIYMTASGCQFSRPLGMGG